jgi:hypothetical protein
MAAKKEAKKERTGKAAPMTYESVRMPNLRYQLQAAARAEGEAVAVDEVIENTGKEK